MTEPHAATEVNEPSGLRWDGSVGLDSQLVGRAPHQRDVADRLCGSQKQQPLRLSREFVHPTEKALFDAARQRPVIRKRETPREACSGRAAGELQ